jgi:hypothetical protein
MSFAAGPPSFPWATDVARPHQQHKSEEETMKLAADTIIALAFASALAVASPARADERQVSGTAFITQVESL